MAKPERFRLSNEQHAHASNVILSHVIDRFFQEPPNFDVIAAELGFQRVEKSDTGGTLELIRQFFTAVCAADDFEPTWKWIDTTRETPLAKAWELVRDREDDRSSRMVTERDLRRVLGTDASTKFETKNRGNALLCRFVSSGRYNAAILAKVELESVADGVHRHRDAIDGGYFAGIPSLS